MPAFGDPEAQVVLPRLKTDLVDICEAVIDEKLSDLDIEWDNGACGLCCYGKRRISCFIQKRV